ncbi:MAG: Asp-tRNA(Asn)/Glu-tRNA(Gln) amidotransferase GatCAB subunit B, partial [Atopobiaceae bacterium]|nr:Asp-tRNA(Asn)/Glu-tRNA(Gln) amidotransferase GatCAB subunit B [Atopobiaceae bacterium]
VMVNLVPGFGDLGVGQVASVTRLLAADAITFVQARDVLAAVDGTADDVEQVVDRLGMRQPADALASVVDEVLGRCQEQVRQYQAGNRKVVGFLVGQCMKASKGSGNPKLFNQLLQERLEER